MEIPETGLEDNSVTNENNSISNNQKQITTNQKGRHRGRPLHSALNNPHIKNMILYSFVSVGFCGGGPLL